MSPRRRNTDEGSAILPAPVIDAENASRAAALTAEEDRIAAGNARRAAQKTADQHAAEQGWISRENARRAALTAAERQAAIEKPIYPRELAERIAGDYLKVSFPDWRLLKFESRGLWMRLVRDQPEMEQPETKKRGELLNLIRASLPGHLRPLLTDLEHIYDLVTTAKEASAFMVGFSLGKKAAGVHTDRRGVVRTHNAPPPADHSSALRLTLAE